MTKIKEKIRRWRKLCPKHPKISVRNEECYRCWFATQPKCSRHPVYLKNSCEYCWYRSQPKCPRHPKQKRYNCSKCLQDQMGKQD